MQLNSLLNQWKSDPGIGPNITAWQTIPARNPSFIDLPDDLPDQLLTLLEQHSISKLYKHQLDAWDIVHSGKNLVITTGTSSGKSLAYQLPVLHKALRSPASRSLLLFPTKALAQDQADWLKALPSVITSVYDGDTPTQQRPKIRSNSQIVISNPDMLHIGILPYHIQWAEFFENLDYVVLDEMHTYRGIFGSHVANVIRRLKRITSHYGSAPQFILTSATIGNPGSLASALVQEDVDVISEDHSSRGEKHFLVYNPPIIDPGLGIRASMQAESIRLADDLITTGNQTILFGRSRRSVEFMLLRLRESGRMSDFALSSYRSGYLKSERRDIEASLKNGYLHGITATNALELGINIGGLDAAILAGFPGTVAGTWQQAGRSGRTDRSSLSILVAASSPMDQYICQHPDFLFGNNIEKGFINPDNLLIVLSHLQCAIYELPFKSGESFGGFDSDQVEEILSILLNSSQVYQQEDTYYWMAEDYPAASISLRNASANQITLIFTDKNQKRSTIGSVDYDSALWMVHPGAVYFHNADSYLVDALDLEENNAHLSRFTSDYYTEADRNTSFEIQELLQTKNKTGAELHLGEIIVTNTVTSFKKINWRPYEILSREPLELPSTSLATVGFWLTLSQDLENHLQDLEIWSSGQNDYGSDWGHIRNRVLIRDNHTCQVCGIGSEKDNLHVHHKQPLRSFISTERANQLDNLITLCPRCHQRAESVVRVYSGIRGLGHLLHGLSPLFVMSDPGDLGLYTDFHSQFGDNRPLVLIYDQVPGGIGFSQSLYDQADELIQRALGLVKQCPCLSGCPSCVGPGGELGSGGKEETKAILAYLCKS